VSLGAGNACVWQRGYTRLDGNIRLWPNNGPGRTATRLAKKGLRKYRRQPPHVSHNNTKFEPCRRSTASSSDV